jgi:hypothetical protein
MALRWAVVVSQAPGLGGTPSTGHRSTGGRERLGGRLLGYVEVAKAPGHRGDNPRPLLLMGVGDRLHDVGRIHSRRNGRTSTNRLQCFDPSVASLIATSRSGASMIQKPPRYSFDSRNARR